MTTQQPGDNPWVLGTGSTPDADPDAPQPGGATPTATPATPGAVAEQVLRFAEQANLSGIVKCPRCGSSDVGWDIPARAIVCRSCRSQTQGVRLEDQVNLSDDIASLAGVTVSERATNIAEDASAVVTLKCTACGAEVVINTDESVQARCHWCRNTLSTDARIQNGAVPDGVVPFLVTREDAMARIDEFVKDRQMFADGRFKKEFTPENVMGVYLPYFVFDGNFSARVSGQGEVETRRWTETSNDGKSRTTYYSADIYEVTRSFDATIDDLFLESSADKADTENEARTNNVLNALLPFNVKEAVQYSPSYLKGFTSERRDLNVGALDGAVRDKLLTVSRSRADEMIGAYDRGVRWDDEDVDVRGARWVTVYLPLWIYSWYEQETSRKHYVAVNGQTGAVMGSVPLNGPLLTSVAIVIGLVATAVALLVAVAVLL